MVGVHMYSKTCSGHRRLSIIGLSDGAQPMSNEDGSVWVTYNGEIYSHLFTRRTSGSGQAESNPTPK